MSDFNKAFSVVLKHEGGFVNDPDDPGGATNFGMSLRYLKARGDLDKDGSLDGDIDGDGDVDYDDIRQMTPADVRQLYWTGWWLRYDYGLIEDQVVATKIFDMSVNMGSRQAHVLLQRACNGAGASPLLVVDGALGAKTLAAVNALSPAKLAAELRAQCVVFYDTLIQRKPVLEKYRRGWMTRALS